MNEEDFSNLDVTKSHMYLAQFNDSVKDSNEVLEEIRSDDDVSYLATPDQVPTLNNIATDLSTNYYLSLVSVITLIIITVILIIVILNNQLSKLNHEFGIMLAIGLKKSDIIKGFLIYGFIFLGFILIGTILGIGLQGGILAQFTAIYNIYYSLEKSYLDALIFGAALEVFLVAVVLILVALKLRIPALALMNGNGKLKSNSMLKVMKAAFRWLPRRLRIKSSFTFYKSSYLFTLLLSIVVIFNLFLIGFSLQTSNMRDFDTYVNNLKYKEYGVYETPESSEHDEIAIQANYSLEKVNDDEIEKKVNMPIIGLKPEATSFDHLQDSLSEENSLVITKKLAYQHEIEEGDKVFLSIDDKPVEFVVSEINSLNLDTNNYVHIESLWEHDPSFDSDEYNLYFAYSDEDSMLDDATYTVSKEEETQQVTDSLNQMNTLLSLLFMATTLISIVLLILIGNLSVTDNRKNIQIFNLLGYSRLKTFNLAIDVYKIPVILFCLIGVLISPYVMNAFESLMNNNESSIYISLQNSLPVVIVIGVLLLVIYYIVFLLTYLVITRRNK